MRAILVPLFVLGLSGCTMFQSNVKGGFTCGAARGTCAPSTEIDDGALHAIDARKADAETPAPAAPSPDEGKPLAASADADAVPGRGALKVVYPAWRDGGGHVHKRTVAYVNVDAPGLVASDGPTPTADHSRDTNLLAIAEAAPDLALVSPSSPAAPGQDGVTGPQPAAAPAQATLADPGPSTSATTTPLSAIQAQVRAILAHAPKPTIRPAAPSPASPASPAPGIPAVPVAPAPATTGGTFPPQAE